MTRRRELDARLALYGDLSGILNAMRSFALAELRRVTQREAAQGEAADAAGKAFADMAPALQVPQTTGRDIWVQLGSVRGFCASFNEDVVALWRQKADAAAPVIAVGERIGAMMSGEVGIIAVPGAVSAIEAVSVIGRILAAFESAREKAGGDAGLVVCFRDDESASIRRLLPFSAGGNVARDLPMTNEPPTRVAAGVAQHYLFHLLLSLLLRSLRVENHMRLMQMENALRHIERSEEDLRRLRNQLRQEEIVEEIELIISANLAH